MSLQKCRCCGEPVPMQALNCNNCDAVVFPASAPPTEKAKGAWRFLGKCLVWIIIGLGLYYRQQQKWERQRPFKVATVDRTRQATATYWGSAVAPHYAVKYLYEYDSNAIAEESYRDYFKQYAASVESVSRVSVANVDPELVAMVQRHISRDRELLPLFERIATTMNLGGQTFAENMAMVENRLSQPDLDPHLEAAWQKLEAINDHQLEQLREIELMQARLSERYRGEAFALPELPADAPVAP